MCGRMMNEPLGRWHFWLTIVGAYATFLPMHIAGLIGVPRHYAQFVGQSGPAASLISRAMPIQQAVTYSAMVLISAQFLFLANLAWSWHRGRPADENPWRATTMEWMPHELKNSKGALSASNRVMAARGPCCYADNNSGAECKPQWAPESKAE
jgi:cytochrome c oxidase subunit 1